MNESITVQMKDDEKRLPYIADHQDAQQ